MVDVAFHHSRQAFSTQCRVSSRLRLVGRILSKTVAQEDLDEELLNRHQSISFRKPEKVSRACAAVIEAEHT